MKNSVFLIFFIILVSFFPRIWELNKYPPVVIDEPAYLRDINAMISKNDYYPANFQWDGSQATLAYLPTILLNKTFIPNQLLALRFTSVLMSLLALIPFFFLVKKYTNEIVAFSSTLMFSCSYYFLQFSRAGWGVIYPLTLGLYLLWIIESLNKHNKYFKLIIAGILAGITFYLYRAGEILIVGACIFLIIKIFRSQERLSKKIFEIFIPIFIFLIISAPWINAIKSNWQFFMLRQGVVSIQNTNKPYHKYNNSNDIIFYQIRTSVKSWLFLLPEVGTNPENPRYLPAAHPFVNPIIILLFILGLIIGIINFKKMYIWFFIYVSGVILGQVLTVDPPNGARGLILLPIIYLFSALSLNSIYNRFRNAKFIVLVLIIFSVIISVIDFLFYQNWMTWIKV
jgi:hypothetical protein